MKIAQISKADSFGGGASRVAEDLHFGLTKNGYFSHHLVSWSGHGYSEKLGRLPLYGRFEGLIRKLHFYTKKLFVPEIVPYEILPISIKLERFKYNILHFHDLSSAISPLTLKYFARKIPVVWTIHDCSAVTAGCLYPLSCNKYMTHCNKCPQFGEWPIDSKIDLSFVGHMIKKYVHKQAKFNLVAPSEWMANFIASSGLVKREAIKVISNGCDAEVFRPLSINETATLGMPSDRLIFLLSSGDISDHRKGVRFAIEVLDKLKKLNPLLVVVGNISSEAKKVFNSFDTYFAGYISDRVEMAKYYSIADAFIFCSIADNQPLAVIESLLCGTPVFGFKTGGVTEMIINNFNGYLVEQGNIDELSNAIENCIQNEMMKTLSLNAVSDAQSKYSLNKMLNSYSEFYEYLVRTSITSKWRD